MSPRAPRLVDNFLDAIAAERGAARNTIDAYRRDLTTISPSSPSAARSRSRPTDDDIRAFLAARGAAGLAPASLARRLSACGSSTSISMSSGGAATIRASTIEGPRRGRPLPKMLTVAEVDEADRRPRARASMRRSARPGSASRRRGMACLIELAYASGLRVSELIALPKSAARDEGAADRRARQGRQGAARADLRAGARGDAALPRAARRSRAGRGCGSVAVSRRRRRAAI